MYIQKIVCNRDTWRGTEAVQYGWRHGRFGKHIVPVLIHLGRRGIVQQRGPFLSHCQSCMLTSSSHNNLHCITVIDFCFEMRIRIKYKTHIRWRAYYSFLSNHVRWCISKLRVGSFELGRPCRIIWGGESSYLDSAKERNKDHDRLSCTYPFYYVAIFKLGTLLWFHGQFPLKQNGASRTGHNRSNRRNLTTPICSSTTS